MKKVIPAHHLADDLESELQLNIVPLQKRTDYDTSVPHRHNYYEIFFFTKGGGNHMIDFIDYPIRSQSIHIVFPGQVHLVRRELDTHGYVLIFSNEFYYLNTKGSDALSDIPNKLRSNFRPVLNLVIKEYSKGRDTLNNMIEELKSEGSFTKEILKSNLDIILFIIRRNLEIKNDGDKLKNKNKSYELYYRLNELLEKNVTHNLHPKDYAKMLSITEKHLNEFVKNVCGKTITELLHDRIILEIKRLLTHSSLSANEISLYLHFDDPSYFIKFFKKKTGVTPKDFQSSFRKKYHF